MVEVGRPTADEARTALAELGSGRRAVIRAEPVLTPALLTTWSLLVLVDYAAKDLLPDRRAQRAMTAACQVSAVAIGLLEQRRSPVQPISVDPADLGPRVAQQFAALAALSLAERVLVIGLRRSGLRRPNVLAGAVLAVVRPAAHVGLQRLLPRPGHDG